MWRLFVNRRFSLSQAKTYKVIFSLYFLNFTIFNNSQGNITQFEADFRAENERTNPLPVS